MTFSTVVVQLCVGYITTTLSPLRQSSFSLAEFRSGCSDIVGNRVHGLALNNKWVANPEYALAGQPCLYSPNDVTTFVIIEHCGIACICLNDDRI